jgi:hypothetical protein
MIETPVLYIIFNRPRETEITFSEIRKAQPRTLYISADGPRKGHFSDIELCQKTREIVGSVDWDCEVHTKFSDENLGCKDAILQAISWMLQNEEYGIILEDDVLPCDGFFAYMEKMLQIYKDDESIHGVLGFNYHGQGVKSNDHFLYNGFYPWGWGTWRRVWDNFDANRIYTSELMNLKKTRPKFKNVLNSIIFNLELIKSGELNTWDYQFIANLIKSDGKCVAPYANLIKNIGANGTHSVNNELEFRFGQIEVDYLMTKAKKDIDVGMNLHLFDEHRKAAFIIFLKYQLLKFGLFPLARKVNRFLKTLI